MSLIEKTIQIFFCGITLTSSPIKPMRVSGKMIGFRIFKHKLCRGRIYIFQKHTTIRFEISSNKLFMVKLMDDSSLWSMKNSTEINYERFKEKRWLFIFSNNVLKFTSHWFENGQLYPIPSNYIRLHPIKSNFIQWHPFHPKYFWSNNTRLLFPHSVGCSSTCRKYSIEASDGYFQPWLCTIWAARKQR